VDGRIKGASFIYLLTFADSLQLPIIGLPPTEESLSLCSAPFANMILGRHFMEDGFRSEDLWLDDRRAPVAAPGLGGLLIHRDTEVSFE
jgi:hypothetical protein